MKKIFSYIERFVGSIFQRIEYSCQCDTIGLAYIRILSGTFFLLVHPPRWQWVGIAPPSFFNPPILSLANLTPGFPSAYFMFITEFVAIILLFFITIGLFTRVSAVLLFFLYIIDLNYVYSFGKIDHSIMLPIMLLCIAFTNAGTILAIRKDGPINKRVELVSLSLLGICIAFGMFSAGFSKTIRWIDFDLTTSGFLSWYYPNYYMYGNRYLLAQWIPFIPQWVIEIAEYLVVFLEISGFIWVLVGRKAWEKWLFLLCIFHLSTHLTLNIPFTSHIIVYSVFLLSPILISIETWRLASRIRLLYCWGAITSSILILRLYESIYTEVVIESQVLSIYGNLSLWLLMILASCFAISRNVSLSKAAK